MTPFRDQSGDVLLDLGRADQRAPFIALMMKHRRALRQVGVSVTLLGLALAPLRVASTQASPSPAAVSPYLLPWEGGKKFLVTQTQGTTHRGAMVHAVDFGLPRGEPIVAARAGKIIFREDRHTACGGAELATRGNYVVIDHGDQTSALYLHLEKVAAAVGQAVQQGDVLGTSGATGWSGCAPHLHFQVQQNSGVWFARSLPVTFNDPEVRELDPNGVLKYNRMYTSGNRSHGSAPTAVAPPPQPAAPSSTSPAAPPSSGPAGQPAAGSTSARSRYTVGTASTLRAKPSTESARLAVIVPGQEFEVLDVVTGQAVDPPEDRWARVRPGNLEGYVYVRLVPGLAPSAVRPAETPAPAPAGTPTPPPPTPATPNGGQSGQAGPRPAGSQDLPPGQWQTKLAASVREQPTRQSARVATLSAGTPVDVRGIVAGEMVEAGEARWARTHVQGRDAYIYVGLLMAGAPHIPTSAPQPVPAEPASSPPNPPADPPAPPPDPPAVVTPTPVEAAPEPVPEPVPEAASEAAAAGSEASSEAPPAPTAGPRTRQAASLRQEPSRASARLGMLPEGTAVEIVEWAEGEAVEGGETSWAWVRAGDRAGFVYIGLLQLE